MRMLGDAGNHPYEPSGSSPPSPRAVAWHEAAQEPLLAFRFHSFICVLFFSPELLRVKYGVLFNSPAPGLRRKAQSLLHRGPQEMTFFDFSLVGAHWCWETRCMMVDNYRATDHWEFLRLGRSCWQGGRDMYPEPLSFHHWLMRGFSLHLIPGVAGFCGLGAS